MLENEVSRRLNMANEEKNTLNFSTFIMGMAHAALVHMGEVEDPITKSKKQELAMARQHIDMLTILAEKTKGNLNESENHLLQNILTDLRMRFVKYKETK